MIKFWKVKFENPGSSQDWGSFFALPPFTTHFSPSPSLAFVWFMNIRTLLLLTRTLSGNIEQTSTLIIHDSGEGIATEYARWAVACIATEHATVR